MNSNISSIEAMSSPEQEVLDLLCIGFGPATLAIAVALEDWAEATNLGRRGSPVRPRARFLERQESFNWHAGMLIRSAKMQISFIKDLATARDPLSRFTFLNYLKEHGRLAQFARLNTFLPARAEFADYMKWTAGHFADRVSYGHEVLEVRPVKGQAKVSHFEVSARHRSTGKIAIFHAKQIVIGIGGSPAVPPVFQLNQPWCLHSSQYETNIDTILPARTHPYRIAVIGSGQSAAEIFDDLSRRRPHAHITLVFRDSALRPSDDSPFVNEVFDPSAVDTFFQKPSTVRRDEVRRDRATNYSVVRLELIEKIYRDLCAQGIYGHSNRRRILASTEIDGVQVPDSSGQAVAALTLRTAGTTHTHALPVDAIVFATGYTRKSHLDMLRPCQQLNAAAPASAEWSVQRDYSLALDRSIVDPAAGIWLQGCNEETHGLSDSLLSILATRSGELVQSIFGARARDAAPSQHGDGNVRPSL